MMRQISCCLLIAVLAAAPAIAGTKEDLMRLQNDVLTLQTQIREFDRSFSEKTEGLKSLVVQLNDQVAKSNLILDKIAATLENQASDVRAHDQAVLQEVQALNGKIDDASIRISALAQQISELKVQAKPISQGMIQAGGGSGLLAADSAYNQAFSDLVQGRFDLAIQGFTAYLNNFPSGEKAAAAQYNIGEAYYGQNKIPAAIAAFTKIINDYPGSDKVASALFKRGKAELANNEKQNAIADFRTVIEKFPAAPESDLARVALADLGVALTKPKEAGRKTR